MAVRPGFATVVHADDRRFAGDRRRTTPRALFHSLYRGRRHGPRRAEGHGAGQYVDVIAPAAAIVAVAIMLLSCADSLFTLLLLQRGATEINPVMDALIAIDTMLFVAAKLAITAVCVLFIVAHRHFRFFRLRGGHVLYSVLALYLALVGYQVTLLAA